MLRKIRITLAVVTFALITGLFLDFTGTLHAWFGWLARIQFLPAVLALNLGVVAALLLLTLLLGRIYCSVICPLGIFQDVAAWLGRRGKRHRFRYGYSPAVSWLRYTVLAVFVIALVAGIGSVVALLAPYSAYGRMVQNLLAPLYVLLNNVAASIAERAGSYAFYEREVWIRSIPTFAVAAATFVVLVVLAWRGGRTYCNTICPVGTFLSFFARFSWFKLHIDTDKCVSCGLCARSCKAACIDPKNHKIDYTRCVVCGDCIGECHTGAITFTHLKKAPSEAPEAPEKVDTGRRSFLVGTALATGSAILAQKNKKVDGGLAVIDDKVAPRRTTPVKPAGSLSISHFAQHCTACQLCVSVCPNDVLRPSTDPDHFMQPTMEYDRGHCRPECTRCSDVCPTGAIRPVTAADKSSTQIGHAVWIKKNCVVLTDDVDCGNCARHCPVGAITMVNSVPGDDTSRKIPAVDTERCIGCGACEHLCPARPFSAIYVEGNEVHRTV